MIVSLELARIIWSKHQLIILSGILRFYILVKVVNPSFFLNSYSKIVQKAVQIFSHKGKIRNHIIVLLVNQKCRKNSTEFQKLEFLNLSNLF